jgi:adenylate cyclase
MDTGEPEPPGAPEDRASKARVLANRIDTQPRLLAAALRLRRRLPGDEKFGDALSTAGLQPVAVVARGVSALRPDRESVAQELGLAGLQLWQSLSEATGRGRGDVPMAIMFTDIVGFSAWALTAGDELALELLREVGSIVESSIRKGGGVIVKRLGDGVMATFPSAQDAVGAALDAQAGIDDVNVGEHRPRLRAGLHWGCPRKLGGDYLGVDVTIAARVCEAAKAEQVLVSEPILELIELDGLRTGRPKRLRADGAPRGLCVVRVSRNSD